MKAKIAIIEPYFGHLPPWNNPFMVTLARNSMLTWIRFSDTPPPQDVPENLVTIEMTLGGLNHLCRRKLGFDPCLKRGYKCCDLRPAFGKVFEDYLADFDYWGYGDSDVLLGRCEDYLDDDLLAEYDAFASCRSNMNGQFAVFRNHGVLRHPHVLIEDFRDQVRNPELQYCEEVTLDTALMKSDSRVLRRQLQIHDVGNDEWRARAEKIEMEEYGNLDELFWEEGETCWKDGRVVHVASGKEAMFFHFHHWKRSWNLPSYPYWPERIRGMRVHKGGIDIRLCRDSRVAQMWLDWRYRLPYDFFAPVARVVKSATYRVKRRFTSRVF